MPRPRLVVCAGQDLFASFFPSLQAKRLSKLFQWKLEPGTDVASMKSLSKAEALITTWDSPRFTQEIRELAPHLRVISHCGGEVKSRFSADTFQTLTITNAAEPMARATAEMGASLLLYSARNIDYYRDALRRRSNRIYQDLHLHGNDESVIGREVAMIGFGRIGRALVEMTRGFELKWLIYDPYASKNSVMGHSVQFVDLETLLPKAHLLVLTAALTEETQGLLGRERLAQLPDGAAIINIARGGLIDLAALTKEVKSRRLRCALDVTDPQEPLPIDHPLRTLPGAIVTPHIAASNRRVREQIADTVLDDLERFFAGGTVKNRVSVDMLARMT